MGGRNRKELLSIARKSSTVPDPERFIFCKMSINTTAMAAPFAEASKDFAYNKQIQELNFYGQKEALIHENERFKHYLAEKFLV
ncbi:hypothetical protein QYF36_016344 [Acer negundo]|nr:hypothetical protein QYF36_016344 [Acer negundo]